MAGLEDLQNFDIDRIGDLPLLFKAIIIALVCMLILGGGFWFLNKPQLEKLKKEEKTMQDLKTEFESKQYQAANITQYEEQLVVMEQTFGELLRKLPSKTEVPGLLEDISMAGVTSGLKFSLFKPLPEREFSFYAELPIQIEVTGDYHQIAEFISKISSLDRIVTVHDFIIAKPGANKGKKKTSASSKNPEKAEKAASKKQTVAPENGQLAMQVIVKTYRYKEETEEEALQEEEPAKGKGKKTKGSKAKKDKTTKGKGGKEKVDKNKDKKGKSKGAKGGKDKK